MRHFNGFGIVGVILALVWTSAAVRADVPAFTMTGFANDVLTNKTSYSLGYTFELDQPTTVTAIGVLDIGGNTITNAQPLPVSIYWSGPTATYGQIYPTTANHAPGGYTSGSLYVTTTVSASDPILSLSGGPYTSGDGFRYHTLDTPVQLNPAPGYTAGYFLITESDLGTGYKDQATGFAAAPSVIGPAAGGSYYAAFDLGDDTAGFTSTTQSSKSTGLVPGIFGPNFLMAAPAPEPGTLGLLLACGGIVLRRRR